MEIKREIDGKSYVFKLTERELYEAFSEQEHRFDCDDVRDMLYAFEDVDLVESYGADAEEILESLDDIAYEMRRQMNKYGVDMDFAREEAIRAVMN